MTERLRPLAWLMSTTLAFVVMLAALLAPQPTASPMPPARVVLQLPAPLVLAVVAALALAEIVLVAFALFSDRRRRKRKDEEELELSCERPKVPAWAMALVYVLALLPVVGALYLLWHGWLPLERWSGGGAAGRLGSLIAGESGSRRPVVSIPLLNWSVAAILVFVAAAAVTVMLWIALGDWLPRRRASAAPEQQPLVEAVDESLDDLGHEMDVRTAIVTCYRRFEQAMERARVPRQPWETPVEYMHAALLRLSLPRGAVESLTRLFELARFSDHPVGAMERERAWTSLDEIRTALERRADAVQSP